MSFFFLFFIVRLVLNMLLVMRFQKVSVDFQRNIRKPMSIVYFFLFLFVFEMPLVKRFQKTSGDLLKKYQNASVDFVLVVPSLLFLKKASS